MKFENVKEYIAELNENLFAGFNNWRLPTLEEAMSLMEPRTAEEMNDLIKYLHINPIFSGGQEDIWTADRVKGESQPWWSVRYNSGHCLCDYFYGCAYVRAVRSVKSSQE